MYQLKDKPLGIYEKALPSAPSWPERLVAARERGFSFVEISVDETDERLNRLEWSAGERAAFVRAIADSGVRVPSMCLSGHRRFPLGSRDAATGQRALEIARRAIEFAVDTGVRVIQLAGYDVYYESPAADTRARFEEGLNQMVEWAAQAQVMLSMEIMDYPLMNSIQRYLEYAQRINSPWFTVYPDIGNLSAWGNDVEREFRLGIDHVTAIHLKDTIAVTGTTGGVFKKVPFGEGCVDFVRFFALLKELSYRGPFVIEMWTEDTADALGEITRAREWIEDKMNSAGYTL